MLKIISKGNIKISTNLGVLIVIVKYDANRLNIMEYRRAIDE